MGRQKTVNPHARQSAKRGRRAGHINATGVDYFSARPQVALRSCVSPPLPAPYFFCTSLITLEKSSAPWPARLCAA
jgi:hypothetical protein